MNPIDKHNTDDTTACSTAGVRERLKKALKSGLYTTGEKSWCTSQIVTQLKYLGFGLGDRILIESLAPKTGGGQSFIARGSTAEELAALAANTRASTNGYPPKPFEYQGIYLHAQPVLSEAGSKYEPGQWYAQVKGSGIKNEHISSLRQIAIDIDPCRAGNVSDISANKDEMGAAVLRGTNLFVELSEIIGEKYLAYLFSGNGVHVTIRLNSLENCEDNVRMIQKFLFTLDALYTEKGKFKIDTTLSDPRRVTPLAGTLKRKGSNDEELGRVHRYTFIHVPDVEKVQALDQCGFEKLVGIYYAKLSPEQLQIVMTAMGQSPKVLNAKDPSPDKKSGIVVGNQTVFDLINAIPVRDVYAKILGTTDQPLCPSCGAGGDSSVAFLDTKCGHNVLKCKHDTCKGWGGNSWKLAARLKYNLDSLKGEPKKSRELIQWFHENFGTPIGRTMIERGGLRPRTGRTYPASATTPETQVDDMAGPKPVSEGEEPATHIFPLTDLGNGERFVSQYKDLVRYVSESKEWLVWNGVVWEAHDSVAVRKLAQNSVRRIYEEVDHVDSADEKTALEKWAAKSENSARIGAMIQEAAPMLTLRKAELDQHPRLLNTPSGIVDLNTGACSPCLPDKLLTKRTGVGYDASASCPLWTRFLERVQPDAEVRRYLQRLIGYSAIGEVVEHVLAVHWGKSGNNGKSTFFATIKHVLGDYVGLIPQSALMVHRGDAHPVARATLHGLRMALAQESPKGAFLDEAFVKEATGGDRLSTRRMHENFWEFEPTHTLHLVTNEPPSIREKSDALWRRMHLIPWKERIPKSEIDDQLGSKLQAEASGILNWIVEGAILWTREHLTPPSIVISATKEYREREDQIVAFLNDCFEQDPSYTEERAAMYNAYLVWCKATDHKPVRNKQLYTRLRDLGFSEKKNNVMCFEGLRLANKLVGDEGTDDSEPNQGDTTPAPGDPAHREGGTARGEQTGSAREPRSEPAALIHGQDEVPTRADLEHVEQAIFSGNGQDGQHLSESSVDLKNLSIHLGVADSEDFRTTPEQPARPARSEQSEIELDINNELDCDDDRFEKSDHERELEAYRAGKWGMRPSWGISGGTMSDDNLRVVVRMRWVVRAECLLAKQGGCTTGKWFVPISSTETLSRKTRIPRRTLGTRSHLRNGGTNTWCGCRKTPA